MGKKLITILTIIILTLNMTACSQTQSELQTSIEPISKTELFMGTAVKLTIYDKNDEEILDKAFNRIVEIENLVSINKENTEINKLNENAGIGPVKLSEDSFNIIKTGIEYSNVSGGGYDISIGPLVKLWNIGQEGAKVPSESEINEAINKVDYSKVEINEATKEVFLKEKGMLLDLGSIAKGYVADELVKLLKEEGVNEAIIDLGGNIYALGKKSGTNNWKVGIQDPTSDRGNVVGAISVYDKSVVTTGIYERFLEQDNVKYHHVLDPKTGYPYESSITGVTIVSDKSMDADALSTLVFTMDVAEGMKYIESRKNIEAIFITENKEVFISSGLENNFELMNEEFTIKNIN